MGSMPRLPRSWPASTRSVTRRRPSGRTAASAGSSCRSRLDPRCGSAPARATRPTPCRRRPRIAARASRAAATLHYGHVRSGSTERAWLTRASVRAHAVGVLSRSSWGTRLWLVLAAAWLIPGAGHLWLGRRQKGLIVLIVLPLMFGVRTVAQGRTVPVPAGGAARRACRTGGCRHRTAEPDRPARSAPGPATSPPSPGSTAIPS